MAAFHLVEGEVRRRDPKDRPPGALRLVTPYDTEARGSVERDTLRDGYKVHLSETCEPETPNLITKVATTVATVHDSVTVPEIHDALAEHPHWTVEARARLPSSPARGRQSKRMCRSIRVRCPVSCSDGIEASGSVRAMYLLKVTPISCDPRSATRVSKSSPGAADPSGESTDR